VGANVGQRNIIAIGIAVFLGLIAVFLANTYFSAVQTKQADIAKQQQMARIVVATQGLAFGSVISQQNVRLVNWPADSVPEGAFTSIQQATTNRVALRPIVPGEPVLTSKVSGTDGRATLSAKLPVGQLAYAIPISDVAGVGGFARPGDVVDVILTRSIASGGSSDAGKVSTVVLEAVPVLGIDQVQDENKTEPAVGKTATLQVDTIGAQKLALSTQMGVLTLALRNVGDQAVGGHPSLTSRDIGARFVYRPTYTVSPSQRPAPRMAAAFPIMPTAPRTAGAPLPQFQGPTMTVVRGVKTTEEGLLRGK
jgi:pilus assembly protein CpaB